MARFEKLAFGRTDAVTAVSEADAEWIRKSGSRAAVEVIENGVDLDFFTNHETADVKEDYLVFTGSMDWRPNQDAAEFFVREIFPLLRAARPAIEAVFVGRNPPHHIARLGQVPGITITGTVEDIRPYIRRAAVYIVPLRVGGGSRLKILEAFAMEKPVVSTSIGAESLAVSHEKELLLADGPEQFASAIVRLLDDRALAGRLAAAGRRLVVERYGWDQLSAQLERFLIKLVGKE
jgi:glycosyltransferase involved in cell wall biosynthesis